MDDIYTVKSSAFPKTTRVLSFRGVEALSRPYRFELFLSVPVDDARDIDLNDVVGTKATLSMHADRSNPVVFNGVLSVVQLMHAHSTYALFRAVLEPRFIRLTLTQHSRLFTNQSAPDVIKAVLEENGLSGGSDDYALQLTGSYAPEEHICQYRESDFDFLSRWMEHLGLYYFFEQGDDKEKLIITDANTSQTDWPTDPIRYFPTLDGDTSAGAAIESFACRAMSLPSSVRLKDYDHTKPTLDVSASATVATNGFGEVSVHGARFFSPDDAKVFAQLRADEMLCRQLEHEASGTVPLRAGYNFTLDEHPIDTFNAKYLAVEVEHHGNLLGSSPDLVKRIPIRFRDVYRCEVTAIPAKVQFRPARKTTWPRIYGFEHGTIDGEQDSDYAQIDDHGRYRVKLAFDESPLKDGKASTWVRMMQPHGGGVEGFHFPQRKNTEVVLAFLGGDPDRPVIAGVVNNTVTPSPITSGNNTRNVIQTGGRNRIEIEDKAGQERISIMSPHKNTYIRMGSPNDSELHIHSEGAGQIELPSGTLSIDVGQVLQEHVVLQVLETYDSTQTTTVGTGRTLTVNGGGISETCTGASTRVINGTYAHTVNGAMTQTYHTQTLKVDSMGDHTYGLLSVKSGPITGNSAAVTWTAADVALTAPSFTVTAPKIDLLSSHVNVVGPIKIETFSMKNTAGVSKNDLTAITVAVTGLKVEQSGAKRSNAAAENKDCGLNTANSAIWSRVAGLAKIG